MTWMRKFLKIFKPFLYKSNIVFKSNNFKIGRHCNLVVDSSSKVIFEGEAYFETHIIIRCLDGSNIQLGKGIFIGDYSTIRASKNAYIKIGNDTMISQGVKLISTNHAYINKDILIKNQDIIEQKKNITIGDDCWLGAGSVVLPGVNIGNGVVVGANSVVTKDVPEYAIVLGSPAIIKGYRK